MVASAGVAEEDLDDVDDELLSGLPLGTATGTTSPLHAVAASLLGVKRGFGYCPLQKHSPVSGHTKTDVNFKACGGPSLCHVR